jgi:hypothetical protein
VHVDAVHPGCPEFTHTPVVHWLSFVHQHWLVPVLHSPVAHEGWPAPVMAGSAVGSTQPRSSTEAVLLPVHVVAVHPVWPWLLHLLPGQSVSFPHWQLCAGLHVVLPPFEHA